MTDIEGKWISFKNLIPFYCQMVNQCTHDCHDGYEYFFKACVNVNNIK